MIETELFNLIFVKNHFRMMISNLFNRKKKKRSDPLCWWPSTSAVFWHFCDAVIAPLLLQRVLPVWDPNSCSVCPGMRSRNLPRGSLRSSEIWTHLHSHSTGAPELFPELFHSTRVVLPTTCLWKPAECIRRLNPSSPPPIPTLQALTWKRKAHSPYLTSVCPGTSWNQHSIP